MEVLKNAAFAALAVCASTSAMCKTVALWPIQRDAIEGTDNLRSAVDPLDDLTRVNANIVDSDIGWILPPNPDDDAKLLFRCVNARAVAGTAYRQQLYSANAGRHLVTTNAFTVEGFVKINDIPAVNGQGVLFFSAADAGSPYSLGVNLWRGKEDANGERGNILTWRLVASNNEGPLCDVPDWDAFTNAWHHFAVTHSWTGNVSTYGFWWDGERVGSTTRTRTITNAEKAGTAQSTYDLQFLSRANGWYGLKATLDWIRISDEVLEPSGFLNAGGSGTAAPYTGSTVAYWPLDRRADGTLDGSPAVGRTALSTGLYDCLGMVAADAKPALSPFFEDANGGDSGSWLAESDGGWWRIAGLGDSLDATGDFGVTGYLKPVRRFADAPTDEYVFGTFAGTAGWALRLVKSGAAWRFVLRAVDASGAYVDDAVLGGDLSDWCEWKKVALAYAAATGTWTLSLDDETWGTVANSRTAVASGAPDFYFGGYSSGANFRGAYDSFTVTSGGATVASWALDISDGVNFDGTDATGTYTYTTVRDALFRPSATAENATIGYPDPSVEFRGDSSANSGAAVLRDTDAVRKRAMLVTSDSDVLAALREDEGFTIECWLYRTRTNANSDWEILMGASGSFSTSAYPTFWQLTYATAANANPGFRIYDDHGYGAKKNDAAFPSGNTECLTLNKWQHLALTAYIDKADGFARYELFLDGTSLGVVKAAGKRNASAAAPVMFFLGGRPTDGRVFRGCVDAVRISRGVLAPSQFLCATAPAHEDETTQVRTVAEWNPPPTSAASVGSRTDLDVPFTIEGWIDGSSAAAQKDTFAVGNYSGAFACGWKLSVDMAGETPRLKLVAHGVGMSPIVATDFGFDASAVLDGPTPVALEYDPAAGSGTWTLVVAGRKAGSVANLYHPGGVGIGCHELKFAEPLACGRWRLSCGVLGMDELLYQPQKGTMIVIR